MDLIHLHTIDTSPGLRAFTLVELLVVVSILAILASIAVPNLLGSRGRAHEAAVIQVLRSVSSAQELVRTRAVLDLDGNGLSEYGFLGEVTGLNPLRGSGDLLSPAARIGFVDVDANGFGEQKGYLFRLYLPDAGGAGVPETATTLTNVDPIRAASFFTVLAWPQIYGSSGQRTFFLNQSGEIVATVDPDYSGKSGAPPANAALVGVTGGVIATNSLATSGQTGADGNRWTSVR
jgi:prepilin-type N-terminal cleavage/methylation domain-containing protein